MKTLVLTGADFILNKCTDQEKIYLGPWCAINNSHLKFSDIDSMPIWQSLENSSSFRNEHQKIYHRTILKLLNSLGETLHAAHQAQQPKFWEATTARWLYEFISTYYERYLRIRSVVSSQMPLQSHVLDANFYFEIENYTDFVLASWNHAYNLQIFSEILHETGSNLKLFNVGNFQQTNYTDLRFHSLKYNFTRSKSNVWKKFFAQFFRNIKFWDPYPRIFLGDIYGLDWKEKLFLKLKLALKSGTIAFQRLPEIQTKGFIERPKRLIGFQAETEFEKIVSKNILKHLPKNFLESFSISNADTIRILIGLDINDIQNSKFVGATLQNQGEYISAQHGGGYFSTDDFFAAHNEFDFCKRYVTWGWDEKLVTHPELKFIPLPSPYLSKLARSAKSSTNAPNKILYVTNVFPLYATGSHPCTRPESQIRFIQNLRHFFSTVDPSLKKKIALKPAYHDNLFDNYSVYKNYVGAEQVIQPEMRLLDLIYDYELFLVDNLFTSFLELMTVNRPCVLMLDYSVHPVSPIAHAALKELAKVGIFYESMTEAQRFLTQSHLDIQAWWNTSAVQSARSSFCAKWALHSPNWKKEWENFLQSI